MLPTHNSDSFACISMLSEEPALKLHSKTSPEESSSPAALEMAIIIEFIYDGYLVVKTAWNIPAIILAIYSSILLTTLINQP